jgi:hypothetical protein
MLQHWYFPGELYGELVGSTLLLIPTQIFGQNNLEVDAVGINRGSKLVGESLMFPTRPE